MRDCLICGVSEGNAEYARCLVEMMNNAIPIDHLKAIPKMKEQTHVWIERSHNDDTHKFMGKGIASMLSESAANFKGPLICGCGDKCKGH